jgi:hypothetical protein
MAPPTAEGALVIEAHTPRRTPLIPPCVIDVPIAGTDPAPELKAIQRTFVPSTTTWPMCEEAIWIVSTHPVIPAGDPSCQRVSVLNVNVDPFRT